MRENCRVVLDACVLIPMPLADALSRMAEALWALSAEVVADNYGRSDAKPHQKGVLRHGCGNYQRAESSIPGLRIRQRDRPP